MGMSVLVVFEQLTDVRARHVIHQLSGNQVETLRALEPQLRAISTLETTYLEGNPCQAKEGANYRRKVILALPQITQLDATYVIVFAAHNASC